MATKQTPERDEPQQRIDREGRDARIRQAVIHLLGRPVGLQLVQVRPLWDNLFRINIFIGMDATSAKIAHSYFVRTDTSGNIIESTPTIGALK